MIAFIKGIVDTVGESIAVIEQGGVGYSAVVSDNTAQRLSKGQEVKLLTYLYIKEDLLILFGFMTQSERAMFQRLISVTGVGPKAAMSLLGVLSPEQIMLAVITDDILSLSKAQGIGKKVAARLVLELKDKFGGDIAKDNLGLSPQIDIASGSGPKKDAIDALASLGYGRGEAARAVMEVYVPELDAEQTIKLALKKLAN